MSSSWSWWPAQPGAMTASLAVSSVGWQENVAAGRINGSAAAPALAALLPHWFELHSGIQFWCIITQKAANTVMAGNAPQLRCTRK